jgi:hypothetical protein
MLGTLALRKAKLVVVFALMILGLLGCSQAKTIVTVNGEPIEQEEYKFALQMAGGDSNQDGTKSEALQALVRMKLIQLEGVKRGLLPSASYTSFVQRWKEENERRALALERNQPIYGPKQYTEENFYNYEYTNLEIRLKEALANHYFDLSDNKLRKKYESTKDQYYKNQPTIVLKEIVEPKHADSNHAYARIQADYRKLLQGDSFMDLFSSKKSDAERTSEEIIDESNKRTFSKHREALLLKANQLQVGEFSEIIEERDKYLIIYCASRGESEYTPFEEVRDEVRSQEIDEQYQMFIDQRIKHAVVQESS